MEDPLSLIGKEVDKDLKGITEGKTAGGRKSDLFREEWNKAGKGVAERQIHSPLGLYQCLLDEPEISI